MFRCDLFISCKRIVRVHIYSKLSLFSIIQTNVCERTEDKEKDIARMVVHVHHRWHCSFWSGPPWRCILLNMQELFPLFGQGHHSAFVPSFRHYFHSTVWPGRIYSVIFNSYSVWSGPLYHFCSKWYRHWCQLFGQGHQITFAHLSGTVFHWLAKATLKPLLILRGHPRLFLTHLAGTIFHCLKRATI